MRLISLARIMTVMVSLTKTILKGESYFFDYAMLLRLEAMRQTPNPSQGLTVPFAKS